MQISTNPKLRKLAILFLFVIFIFSISFLLIPGKIFAANLNVGAGETYTTIQSAIDAASDGDIIFISPGTYTENLVIESESKSFTLHGNGNPEDVIIMGNRLQSVLTIYHFGGGVIGTITLENLTITNGEANTGGGINNSLNLVIDNCIIKENYAASGLYGGGIYTSGPTIITDSIIKDNTAGDGPTSPDVKGGGIYCTGTLTISNSSIEGNIRYTDVTISDGIYDTSSSSITNAINNWWGSSTGPYHPTSNPTGTGDAVSDYIDFEPWLTSNPFTASSSSTGPVTKVYQKNANGFIEYLYNKILGRNPDSDGLEAWLSALNNAQIDAKKMVYEIIFSVESQEKIKDYTNEEFITFLYNSLLDRNPDSEGFNGWIAGLEEGLSKEEIVIRYLDSLEFEDILALYGLY